MASIDAYSNCLISEVDAMESSFFIQPEGKYSQGNLLFLLDQIIWLDPCPRALWSHAVGSSLIFMKFHRNRFNLLNVEKNSYQHLEPIQLEKDGGIMIALVDCPNLHY